MQFQNKSFLRRIYRIVKNIFVLPSRYIRACTAKPFPVRQSVSCTATALSTCERAANPLMLIRLSQQTGAPLGLLLCESPGYGALLKQPDKHKSTRVFSD